MRGCEDLTGGFGALLRTHRAFQGLTQEELSDLSGLSVRAIADMERGRTGRPYPRSVQRLADALGLSSAERQQLRQAARAAGAGGPPPAPDGPRYPPGQVDEYSLLTSLLAAVAGAGGTLTVCAGETDGTGTPTLALHWSPRASGGLADGQLDVSVRGTSPAGGRVSPAEAIRAVLGAVLGSASPGLPEGAGAADGR